MGGLYRIYVELGGKHGEVDHHVAHLLFNMFSGGRIHTPALRTFHPLKDLHQFRSLNTEGHCQILGGVKLLPIPFADEFYELWLEFFHAISLSRGICGWILVGFLTLYSQCSIDFGESNPIFLLTDTIL